jgi:hypothetical protein
MDDPTNQAPGATRACPHCGGDILAKALQCRHCRRWMPELMSRTAAEEADVEFPAERRAILDDGDREPAAEPAKDGATPSNARSVRHFVMLTLLSFGLYEFYWFYRNWRDLSEVDRGKDPECDETYENQEEDGGGVLDAFGPGWRTAGLVIPFLNMALVYDQLKNIRASIEKAGLAPIFAPAPTAIAFFALAIVANLTGFWILSLFTVFPLVPVQVALNEYWKTVQPGREVNESVTPTDMIIVAAGIAMMAIASIVATRMA